MKRLLPLLLLTVAFSACNTLSNRRDLYSPIKPDGPYTKAHETGELPDKADLEEEKAQ